MANTFFIGIGFVVGTMALVWAGYFLMRTLAYRHAVDDTKELAGSVIFRVSALHGLILALVFAQLMNEYRDLQGEIVGEATAVADIYFDAKRHGGPQADIIQPALSRYVDAVLAEEWASLGAGTGLVATPWIEWENAYQAVLDMAVDTPRQASLRDRMLGDINTIAALRDKRANHGLKSLSTMFWFAALSGVALISLAYYCYQPTFHNMLLVGIFAAYTGIILFLIYSFSNPFSPPGALQPAPFVKLQASEMFK